MIQELLTIIISYLIGSISISYLVIKHYTNEDIRNHGSGNAGATNVSRLLGKKVAIAVFIADILKGVIVVILAKQLTGEGSLQLLAGIAVVVGHNWPIYIGFKGGKGIATSLGVLLVIFPKIALLMLPIGVLIIVITKYVSLASLLAALFLPILTYIFGFKLEYIMFSIALSGLAIYKHKANINRLIKGQESRFGDKVKNK